MSIIAASVYRRNGELLISRQFEELESTRTHDLLAVPTRLLKSDFSTSTHEEDGIRYVFEALDELLVVLISNAQLGNIIREIQTLRLLTQVVKQTAAPNSVSIDAKDVIDASFPILDAFDEVITMGYSEKLTPSQVDTFMRMESQEEKIQEIIERNKQLEAAESRKRRAKMLEAQRSSESLGVHGIPFSTPAQTPQEAYERTETIQSLGASQQFQPETRAASGHGLRLGHKRAEDVHEANLPSLQKHETSKAAGKRKPAAAPAVASITTDIVISEQLNVKMTRDGTVESSRANGTLSLFAGDREHTKLEINTAIESNVSDFKPHPKTDRAQFSSSKTLCLKNKDEEFPASNVLLVKWTVNNVSVPIFINSWVSSNDDGFMTVTLEYELNSEFDGELENVSVQLPLPTSNAHAADPDAAFEQDENSITWLIPSISANSSGSFEFVAEADTEDDFYPISVAFETKEVTGLAPVSTFGKIDVQSVVDRATSEQVEFTKTAKASTASFLIK